MAIKRRPSTYVVPIVCVVVLILACMGIYIIEFSDTGTPDETTIYLDPTPLSGLTLEADIFNNTPAIPANTIPQHPGYAEKRNSKAIIDYSNTRDGYVMCWYSGQNDKRIKVQIKTSTNTYTYNLPHDTWVTFPLSEGNTTYKVTIFENTTGTKYATCLSQSFEATLGDEFAPFIRPNQYVNYENAAATVSQAANLCTGIYDPLAKVEVIYDYVINTLTYDKQFAATVQSGYLPDLDAVLTSQKGICFDYAALMTGMLRSQGVPCKLVVGYAGTAYHAWISVYSDSTGWIDGAIYFDGQAWQRMDPTFASTGNSSAAILKYIGDGSNYTAKYFY